MKYTKILSVSKYITENLNKIHKLTDVQIAILKNLSCAFNPDEKVKYFGLTVSEDKRSLVHPIGATKYKDIKDND